MSLRSSPWWARLVVARVRLLICTNQTCLNDYLSNPKQIKIANSSSTRHSQSHGEHKREVRTDQDCQLQLNTPFGISWRKQTRGNGFSTDSQRIRTYSTRVFGWCSAGIPENKNRLQRVSTGSERIRRILESPHEAHSAFPSVHASIAPRCSSNRTKRLEFARLTTQMV